MEVNSFIMFYLLLLLLNNLLPYLNYCNSVIAMTLYLDFNKELPSLKLFTCRPLTIVYLKVLFVKVKFYPVPIILLNNNPLITFHVISIKT